MKRILGLMISALTLCALVIVPPAGAAVDYSMVKVKLSVGTVANVGVGVNGSYFILENNALLPTSGVIVSVVPGQAAIAVTDTMGNVLFSGAKATFIRLDQQTSGSGVLRIVNAVHGTRNYLGHMIFSYNNGAVMVVNQVPMQPYLYGVVGHEMNDSWPIEALKAQAVAARGYAVRMMTGASYDLVDTAADQVYKGYNAEYTNVIKAVEDTAWEVLYYGGQIVKTFYAASNGGQTDLASNAWKESFPYFTIKDDPYDLANPLSLRANVKFPKDNVSNPMSPILDAYLKTKIGPLLQQQGYSPYSDQIRILGVQSLQSHTPKFPEPSRSHTMARITVLVAAQIAQQMFDPNTGQAVYQGAEVQVPVTFDFAIQDLKDANLPYQLFKSDNSLRMFWSVEQPTEFLISNVRYGHGVGMSQRGAQQMALSGMGYRDILAFYYVNTQLQKISGQVVAAPTPLPQVVAGQTAVGVVTSSTLNMRAEPNTKAKKILTLKKNAQLTITADTGTWYACTYQDKSGYVSKDYVRIISQATQQADPNQLAATAPPTGPLTGTITADSVNVRSGAGTNYGVVGTLNKNTSVQVLSQFGDWYQISGGGLNGYVSNSYIAVDVGQVPVGTADNSTAQTPAQAATPTLDPNKIFGQVIADSTSILKKASTSSGKVKDVSKGYVIEILAQNDTYYKVSENGSNYWMLKSAIQLLQPGSVHPNPSQLSGTSEAAAPAENTQTSDTKKGKITGVNSFTYIYGKADTKSVKIAKIMKDDTVTITAEKGSYYYVKSDSTKKVGYVQKKYVSLTNNSVAADPTATPKPAAKDSAATAAPKATKAPKATTAPKAAASAAKATQKPKPTPTPSAAPKADAPPKSTVTVAPDSAKVYVSVGSKIYSSVGKGTKLTVLGSSGAYYKVSFDGKTGFISKEQVK